MNDKEKLEAHQLSDKEKIEAIKKDKTNTADKEKLEDKEKIKETKKIVNKLLHDLKKTMHEADQTCVDDFLEPIITDYLKKMKKTLNS